MKKSELYLNITAICITSIMFILPQLLTHNMILGSDSIFHFNRFYDTAQQIKENNFQYFISMYGFQQSGRIVTPLYAPIFSYILGFLLLLCGSWYKFQIVSNFLLFFVSGTSMYLLLSKFLSNKKHCLNISLLYMTTYSISYWVIRQGFSSWGAAFLPLCMIPIISLVVKKEFKLIQIASSMALIFQIHFLSSIMLASLYLVAFLIYFLQTDQKIKSLWKLFISVCIFFVLTINIWFSFWVIYKNNMILPPFMNKEIFKNTVTYSSWYWLINPFIFPIIILLVILVTFKEFKKMSCLNQYFSLMALFFLILSSNLFPWKFLYQHNVQAINFVQFPFRFFIPTTICLLCSFGLSIKEKLYPFSLRYFNIIVMLCVIHNLGLYTYTLKDWDKPQDYIIDAGKHVFVNSNNSDYVKESFYTNDLKLALNLVVKSTPDYLPIYNSSPINKYSLYEQLFFSDLQKDKFTKTVIGNSLIVSWESNETENITIPIIKYNNTFLLLDDAKIINVSVNTIGAPIIKSTEGFHTLKVWYGLDF